MPPSEVASKREIYVEVDTTKLPSLTELQKQVKVIIDKSSWMERHGWDLAFTTCSFVCVPVALYLLQNGGIFNAIVATVLLSAFHSIVANKYGHVASHGGATESTVCNKFLAYFCVEFIGSFSQHISEVMHVHGHHPHTNIIDLGDSSIWRVPQLTRLPYLFIAPAFVPLITPLASVVELVRGRYWKRLLLYLFVAGSGIALHVYVLMTFASFAMTTAIVYLFTYRAVFAFSYIHFNIFQHIGLPMYAKESRPARIYQMSTGVLNLDRNPVLDTVYGHALINCHVEHHLFPRLTDNMCLKIKPTVRAYLRKNGLPYNEDSYMSRLRMFWNRYDELMVDAPPITHFVGIQ